jgi:NADH:ubiquinone oxidoreductase subunit 4 (subunit M)
VEAPSGFSIYLSGFLVKTALYGFFKVTNLFCFEGLTLLYAVIAIVGTVDASLKMWGQSDLKKMVAYCTVQEMNMIFLLFLLGDSNCTTCGALFSIAHAFLSALMFFLVDCIYRRFHTRSVFAIQGLLSLTPNLAMAIFIMCVLYAGLPGTVKFTCELGLLMALSEGGLTPVMIILFFANIIGLVGFSKSWFNVIFGLPSKELNRPVADLSLKEAMIIIYIILCFVLLNGFGILVI